MDPLSNFLYPNMGQASFRSSLQRFGQYATFVSGLCTNGKISPAQAFACLEQAWAELEQRYLESHPAS